MILVLNTMAANSHQAIVTGLLEDLAMKMGVTAARPWTIVDRVIDMPDPTKDNNLAALTAANAELQAAHDALVAEHASLLAQLSKLAAIQRDLA